MSAFWIGLPIGIVLGTFLAFFILLFFMGASERMTKEEWESRYRLDEDHAIRADMTLLSTPVSQHRAKCTRRGSQAGSSRFRAGRGGCDARLVQG
jgi:hypothetical protein